MTAGRTVLRHISNSVAMLGGAAAFNATIIGGLGVILARAVVTSKPKRPETVRVFAVHPDPEEPGSGTIELQRTIESEPTGRFTIHWGDARGRAFLGPTVTATAGTVTRRYFGEQGMPIAAAKYVRSASAPHRDVSDLGLPWEEVQIETELGNAPAWLIPATEPRKGDWVIHVHGRGASRAESLRTVPLAAARGWNSLVISYRNDPEAPRAVRGHYGLGLTEWRDVDAAIDWAIARGATRVLLSGWSMGGAIAAQTYLRSRHGPLIRGLMLESPGVDWRATIGFQPAARRLPDRSKRFAGWLLRGPLGRAVLGLREPVDLKELDLVTRAPEIEVPVLLLHSTGDTVVPVAPSRRLAAARPEWVEYVEFTGARHVRLWNREPEHWEEVVGRWLDDRTVAD